MKSRCKDEILGNSMKMVAKSSLFAQLRKTGSFSIFLIRVFPKEITSDFYFLGIISGSSMDLAEI